MAEETASVPESVDQLYLQAENLAQDFSLFPSKQPASVIDGLLTEREIRRQVEKLKAMDVDAYIASTVTPCEEASRPGARDVIEALNVPIHREVRNGPLYAAEVELDFGGTTRRVGFITQDRAHAAGVWMPEHHEQAARLASDFAIRSMPIVCFMDTPGADAGEVANANNQAHAISRLIAELCNVDVPTIGVILGQGYSGGAIPLAASNLLVSCRTAVFNTIQPKGLASLVRRYNLSWQECAQFVGVSPYELYQLGLIDGVVDYDPGEENKIGNLKSVIVSGILSIEQSAKDFVDEHPEILDHYKRNITRYLHPSETLSAVHASSTLKLRTSPTEYPNLFGATFRYLRYLSLRKRIRSTTIGQYGRLAESDIPEGELASRMHRERRTAFLNWLQDPDKILYDDALNKAWKNFTEKKQQAGDERGRIAQLLFGEPVKNYENAKRDLCLVCGMHLYNRWKADARDNLIALIEHMQNEEANSFLLRPSDVKDVKVLLRSISDSETPFLTDLKMRFGFEGQKLFSTKFIEKNSEEFLTRQLVSELNLLLEGESLYDAKTLDGQALSEYSTRLIAMGDEAPTIELNRRLIEDSLWSYVERRTESKRQPTEQDRTILDVILNEDVRDSFIEECKNFITFSAVYDALIGDLVEVARHANESRKLPADAMESLLDRALDQAQSISVFEGRSKDDIAASFSAWIAMLSNHSRGQHFLKSVEEWNRSVHIEKSDTLFVVVSFIFEKLVPEYYASKEGSKRYDGKVDPVRIGRRKDFWNRLTVAYRDLLFNELLTGEKRKRHTTKDSLVERFVRNFDEMNGDLMSANPVAFPTFRTTIEAALKKDVTPSGLVTGIGDFCTSSGSYRAGIVVSNVDFQVGCIDNADCVKFCKLLVECAIQRLPVVCFISSGGMQTKEGAAALFTMAVVNDRITRFVRDNDLPIIMFGFGDCTGGAQASFVTHPLVQTYYFSGTSMPFAGQAVVQSNLPFTCLLSNYLSVKPGSMRGLVTHPFADGLDEELRRIDPDIPLPTETVEQVVDRIMAGRYAASEPLVTKATVSEDDLFRPIRKVLVHARGCTAVKLVSKAKEFGYEVVLVQSDPDMDSVPADLVRDDDKHALVCIGGNTSDESYLNALSVISVAQAEQVDALHPGIGFLSEEANFARLVRERGVNFIGPKVSSMETMSNKSNAINTTMKIGVPVVPGSHGIVNTWERAAEISENIGYPVLLKAVQGGGGKGIVAVHRPEQLHSLFHQVSTEAKAAFGNGDLYIEKFVTSMRHIEAQIVRDTHGNTHVLGIRDCSVQRNNQKLMEESGSTMLSDAMKAQVLDHARKIADAVDYVGAGTVEFIYDVPSDAVYFMEMNTRLQVEHPVTEMTTSVDIVRQQFEIAAGGSIKDLTYDEHGYALEVRVNAEKAVLNAAGNVSFSPTPGEITKCEFPEQDNVSLISMAAEGKVVPPFYDSLICQIIVYGNDRNDAIEKMYDYLDRVVIHGISTNISLVKRILKDPEFIEGQYDTGYLPKFLARIDAHELIAEIEEASGTSGAGIDLEMLRIEGSDELKVLSPSTGVFYLTPSPSEPEYVQVGDKVSTGDTLCQLEAMKVFTPLNLDTFAGDDGEVYSSKASYEVTRINVASGQQVNEGDLLFVIRPRAEEEQAA